MKHRWLRIWLLTALCGTLLHFVYDLVPNPLTALFSPVNESPWEHLKLLFWPYLAAAWLTTRREPEPWRVWAGHLTAELLMPVLLLGLYDLLLAGFSFSALWFDIGLYYVVLALGFALAAHIARRSNWRAAAPWLVLAVALYALLLTLFTFNPPALPVFVSPDA